MAAMMSARQWVAVVDDDDSLRASIVRLLGSVDVAARPFASAEAFLDCSDCTDASAPACALVDVYLGAGLNGYELKERLTSDGRALPIVFMTAQSELPIRMHEDAAAVATCLRKPFAKNDLLTRLAPMIDSLRGHLPPTDLEGG